MSTGQSLADREKQKLANEGENKAHRSKGVKNLFVNKNKPNSARDKAISLRVNSEIYEKFTKINKTKGTTNSNVLNEMMYEYVYKNKFYLEREY